MSTSFIYHAFGAKTYQFLKQEFKGGAIYFHLEKKKEKRRCVNCKSRKVTLEGRKNITLRNLPIGLRPTYLVLHLHILNCHKCGKVLQESRDVAAPRKTYTRRLSRYVIALSRSMTLQDICRHVNLGWDLIKEIIKSDLKRRVKLVSWRKVRRIAIDEIAIRKGHRYLTIVLDLDTGHVLFTAEGNDHNSLKPFFLKLKRSRAKLQAIAVDMSRGYAKAIKEFAPKGVTVVFDKYHVIAQMNRVIDDVRRAEQKRLEGKVDLKVLKGSRYLLLYGIENLAKKDETHPLLVPRLQRLDALLEANQTLYEVYMLKEELRCLWSHPDRESAEDVLNNWLEDARQINQPSLKRFANTLDEQRNKILAHYYTPITTGPLEGLNNKAKVLKRVAYGYRDTEFFQLRLLFIHDIGQKHTGV